jgi:ABC-2 type transport system ATP-binding protein
MEGIIRTRDLTRRFDALTAVDHLNLEIPRGEIFGLVGPDGAGKTTTLRVLSGLLDPSEGQAWVAGHDVAKDTQAVKDSIGYMAQRFGLYVDLTVDENMEFYADLFGVSAAERRRVLPDLLRMTRMEPFRGRQAGKLSGGMKQKLGLMCTLLHRPEILFLDEPTNGVDPVSRRDFWAILYQLVKDGVTVFVTTAYLDEAERCNRVGLMDRGRLIRCDAPESLRRQMEENCYELAARDLRAAREFLQTCDGVLSAEPSGATLHLFLEPAHSPETLGKKLDENSLGPASFRRITPSLEDVFIALIRKSERAA